MKKIRVTEPTSSSRNKTGIMILGSVKETRLRRSVPRQVS